MDENTKYLWMKHLLSRLEHFDSERRAAAGATRTHLGRAIERDLGQFRRLCHSLRRDALVGAAP